MDQEPYRSARRVFWVVDNGSSHRGERAADELRERHPNIVVVHTPVHASWLNQVEIYFSIIQRKVLTPNHCATLDELIERIVAFGERLWDGNTSDGLKSAMLRGCSNCSVSCSWSSAARSARARISSSRIFSYATSSLC